MTQVVEAIYTNGVLRPLTALALENEQRVRLQVETVEPSASVDRAAALQQLWTAMDRLNIRITGPLPSRDELHERD